jgi:hypothetical protein
MSRPYVMRKAACSDGNDQDSGGDVSHCTTEGSQARSTWAREAHATQQVASSVRPCLSVTDSSCGIG